MKTLTLTHDRLIRIADLLNLDGDDVRTGYSGRGMRGATCVGFVIEPSEVVALGVAIATVLAQDAETSYGSWEDALDDALELARNATVDSMGRGTIAYFPSLTCPDTDPRSM